MGCLRKLLFMFLEKHILEKMFYSKNAGSKKTWGHVGIQIGLDNKTHAYLILWKKSALKIDDKVLYWKVVQTNYYVMNV